MKLDALNMFQIIFILIFFMGIFYYALNTVKSFIKRFDYKFTRKIRSHLLDYSRHMIVKDYMTFEKYDIWRYCVHF